MSEQDPDAVPDSLRAGEGREIELKLEVPAGELAALEDHPLIRSLSRGRQATQTLRTVYFDTPDLDLARERLALRVRHAGKTRIQALKGEGTTFGGLFVRGEWEAEIPGDVPDLERISSPSARALAKGAIGEKPLAPLFETEFRRTHHRLVRGETELSLDLDEGEIRARGRTLPIRELELELVHGEPGVLHGIALELHESVPLRVSIESKAQRGYALASGARPAAKRAGRVRLHAHATLEDALVAVLAASLEQVLANLAPAREGSDPEGVHQLRVALRRTRAALSLFRDVLPAEPAGALKRELRWLAGELGPARELDVFLAEILEPLTEQRPEEPGLKRLRDAARELRDEAYAGARVAIDRPRAGALALALGGWLTGRAWHSGATLEREELLAAPASECGAGLLERRLEKVLALGRGLARRTPSERHRLRIEIKKLRYASEFLGSLYPERRTARAQKRLAALQDTLGALNDVATAERLVAEVRGRLGREWSPTHERTAGFLLGWAARDAERRLAKLGKEWREFRRARPFWR